MPKLLHYYICNYFAGLSEKHLSCTGTKPKCIIYISDKEYNLPPRPPPFSCCLCQINESDFDDLWLARNRTGKNRHTLQPVHRNRDWCRFRRERRQRRRRCTELSGFIIDNNVY